MPRLTSRATHDITEHEELQPQRRERAAHRREQTLTVVGGPEFGPWLTAETAARFLDYPRTKAGVKAFRKWAARAGVPTAHRGRRVLYGRQDLLQAIGAARRPAKVLH